MNSTNSRVSNVSNPLVGFTPSTSSTPSDKINVEPKIIFDLFTALNEVKNHMFKDIKRYIDKYENLINEYEEHKIYLITFNGNITKLNFEYEIINTTFNLINELLNKEKEDKILIPSLKPLINKLKLSFESFIKIFIDTRTHFKRFQKNNKDFKGYTLINKLFNMDIYKTDKIRNLIFKMTSKNYLFTLYNNTLKELNRVKNKYEYKFINIDNIINNKFNNLIYNYINKFKDVFKYKIFIMKILNLKFYLSRVETFKHFPEFDENNNQLTLNEMKINEYEFLNTYQEEPAIKKTFGKNSTFESIEQTLNNFLNVIEIISNNFDENRDKLNQFKQRFKEVKAHLKDIFKQINRVKTIKEGKIINVDGENYINDLIFVLNEVYKVNIDKKIFTVIYSHDIDPTDLKEYHTQKDNEEFDNINRERAKIEAEHIENYYQVEELEELEEELNEDKEDNTEDDFIKFMKDN